jgi:hypothetical protein
MPPSFLAAIRMATHPTRSQDLGAATRLIQEALRGTGEVGVSQPRECANPARPQGSMLQFPLFQRTRQQDERRAEGAPQRVPPSARPLSRRGRPLLGEVVRILQAIEAAGRRACRGTRARAPASANPEGASFEARASHHSPGAGRTDFVCQARTKAAAGPSLSCFTAVPRMRMISLWGHK